MSHRASPLDNEQCRQCTSFADYVKQTKKKYKEESSEDMCFPEEAPVKSRNDCPLDKDELGNKTWGLLHTIAAKYPDKPSLAQKSDVNQFFTLFSRLYPCKHCAADFKEELKENPPQIESQESLSQWLCNVHNNVNIKLGKPKFDCSKVNERWRDGWLDGSCG